MGAEVGVALAMGPSCGPGRGRWGRGHGLGGAAGRAGTGGVADRSVQGVRDASWRELTSAGRLRKARESGEWGTGARAGREVRGLSL